MIRTRKILWFLALTLGMFGLIHLSGWLFDLERFGIWAELGTMLAYWWAPGIAALIVHMGIYDEPLVKIGLVRKYMNRRWYWAAAAMPYAGLLATVGLIYLMGNILHLPGFGEIALGLTQGIEAATGLAFPLMQDMLPAVANTPPFNQVMLFTVLIMGILLGTSLVLFFTLGEEIGWRGLMIAETRSLGFWESNLLSGFLWGLFYLPRFSGELGAAFPWLDLATLIAFCISTSFLMSYLNTKANSILASAAFRGVFNFAALALMFLIIGGNDYVGSLTGLTGMLVFLGITWLLLRFDKDFVAQYPELVFHRPEPAPEDDTEGDLPA